MLQQWRRLAPSDKRLTRLGLVRRMGGHRAISLREHAGSLELMAGPADRAWRGIGGLRDGQHLDELTCLLIGHLIEGYGASGLGV